MAKAGLVKHTEGSTGTGLAASQAVSIQGGSVDTESPPGWGGIEDWATPPVPASSPTPPEPSFPPADCCNTGVSESRAATAEDEDRESLVKPKRC